MATVYPIRSEDGTEILHGFCTIIPRKNHRPFIVTAQRIPKLRAS
jgi:hypothetical protein